MVKKRSTRDKVQRQLARRLPEREGAHTEGGGKDVDEGQKAVDLDSDLSKGLKRKLAKKLRFHEKLATTQKALSTRKLINKKKRKGRVGLALGDLSSLADHLPAPASTLSTPFPAAPRVVRNKARREITKAETKQLVAVLDHPAFKADPIAAIRQHLENTMPPSPAKKSKAKDPSQRAKKKKKKKKKEKKQGRGKGQPAVSEDEGMDIA